jgi:hypothetical protein
MPVPKIFSPFATPAIGGFAFAICAAMSAQFLQAAEPQSAWRIGMPIVTSWAPPALTDAVANQMAEGGWNLVVCEEKELDVAQRHGLRAILNNSLLNPDSFAKPVNRAKLDALIDRMKHKQAMYAYFIADEPTAGMFPAIGTIVKYLREHDPAHLAYINLYPTYAANSQLGTNGSKVEAYNEYLRLFITEVRPSLLSYDHYQFATGGDAPEYFLNLGLVRRAGLNAHIPFLNIFQACAFGPPIRIPTPAEERFLTFTTLAYGGQGISHFVYTPIPGFSGGIAAPNGKPTELYEPLKTYNREFVAIAKELQPLTSLAVYHTGMLPPGTEPLPGNVPFQLDPPITKIPYKSPERVRGILLGYFGRGDRPSHVVVVNLDYKADANTTVIGPGDMQTFDALSSTWSAPAGKRVELKLPPGGGTLLRLAQ